VNSNEMSPPFLGFPRLTLLGVDMFSWLERASGQLGAG
jgi:hypothetical protein